jgi:hypothetical protein
LLFYIFKVKRFSLLKELKFYKFKVGSLNLSASKKP